MHPKAIKFGTKESELKPFIKSAKTAADILCPFISNLLFLMAVSVAIYDACVYNKTVILLTLVLQYFGYQPIYELEIAE